VTSVLVLVSGKTNSLFYTCPGLNCSADGGATKTSKSPVISEYLFVQHGEITGHPIPEFAYSRS